MIFIRKHITFMKIFYTTLLITFVLASQSGYSQNKDYKKFYKSINGARFSAQMDKYGIAKDAGIDSENIKPEQLGSLINNMSGVLDISVAGKSVMKPIVGNGVTSVPSSFKGVFGCPATAVRTSMVGRAYLDPKISGMNIVKNTASNLRKTQAASAANISRTNDRMNSNEIYSSNSGSAASSVGGEDWKLLKYGDISLLNSSDQAFLKSYSIVLGTFRSLNNAEFIRRTFNSMGERSIVVRNTQGNYYALLGSFDTESEAIQALDNATKKYTEGVSRTRRVSRFGIPLDDMWILKINR